QVQRPLALVLVLDPHRPPRRRWLRRRLAGARLQAGLLIDTQHHLVGCQGPGVQIADLLNLGGEGRIPWHLGRQPQVMPPRLEAVVVEDPAHRVGRDGFGDAVSHQLTCQLLAVPLGQGAAVVIRSLARHLDQVQRHLGGKRPAAGRCAAGRGARLGHASGSGGPTCGHSWGPGRRWRRPPPAAGPDPAAGSGVRGAPSRRAGWSCVASAGVRPVVSRSTARKRTSCGRAWGHRSWKERDGPEHLPAADYRPNATAVNWVHLFCAAVLSVVTYSGESAPHKLLVEKTIPVIAEKEPNN